jgi:transposase-like protein
LHGLELIVSDAHAGLKEARQACLSSVPWQRCQFHLLKNALQHVPKDDLKREVLFVSEMVVERTLRRTRRRPADWPRR